MRQKIGPAKAPAEQVVKEIRRATRRQFSAEDKIRIVLEGLRGEDSIAELCRREGLEAPWVLDGPINAEAFKTYVRAELIKTLKPNDIVVLDNFNSHKGNAVRAMVKAIGARLFFLPSYSPDLNPIEQAFAKIKHAMRKAMGRTVEAVESAVAKTIDTITPQECANYLANAEYQST